MSELKSEKPSGFSSEAPIKSEYSGDDIATVEGGGLSDPNHVELHRALKARHITMIAIGGAIGTGLIIGTGEALAKAGPGSILIAYTWVGFIVYLVMCALGEMAAWLPLPSGFTGYAVRFCDPALGFAVGWTYWFKYILVTPNQLTAGALVISYWIPAEKVNPGVWITVFLLLIICINYFGVKFFGEFEFWLSSFKVVVILGIILLSFILMLGGGPDHDRKGFRYWKNPGAFAEYIDTGAAGRFYAFWSTMVSATFAYLGTELVGVTVGEAQNPRRTIPRAIRLTFYRILVFYVLSVLLVGTLVKYNDPKLAFAVNASSSAAASPFVVAIENAGIPALSHILNACILLFVFSAANSDLYIATRTIYGLAREGKAPKIFSRTDRRGVPIFALGVSAVFALLAYMNVSSDSKTVFKYFVNLVTIFGLLTWISILVTHIYFVRARRAQNVPNSELAYVAPFGIYGSYGALAFCILIAFTKNFNVFTHSPKYGNFDYKNFITAYLGIPLYLILILGYKLTHRGQPKVTPENADLWSGKDEIDREEAAYLAQKEAQAEKHTQSNWFYQKCVSWLF
ncbi:Major facilitator superfamily domain general substrate transporter [Penicillium atrosanguineum]|uniref:Dicarboxylic amino acid permease n=1 Tax=Penicillium atrosanguineum TaxID=1132637 RepID=A0A9W9U6A4_9EURO|nr:Major facilitator superfamily domain general substrate transporter [Penicillium atrosanguineum]KAJ5122702.1 Dicarboxylic amino acid permease [Penicillium atrosanguineum]KAJ5310341.1 Major facilitator superfamily domain general substrate transporter [Penicillium atrosanguineum]KAJ5315860.1 Dicarboxylic amino acid permease [Penicillium atrosanguineum]